MNNSRKEELSKKVAQKKVLKKEELLDYINYNSDMILYRCAFDDNEVRIYFNHNVNREETVKLCEQVKGWRIVDKYSFDDYEILEEKANLGIINNTEICMADPKFKIEDIRDLSPYLYNSSSLVADYLEEKKEELKDYSNLKGDYKEEIESLEEEIRLAEQAIKKYGDDVILIGDWMSEGDLIASKDTRFSENAWKYYICPKIVMKKED